MKVGIIGAGISGLSIGNLLNEKNDIEILEKNNYIGGIARVKELEGIPYHMVGGHCFNSKNEKVLEFVFNNILEKKLWHKNDRISKIRYRKNYVDYPFEFSIKQIYEIDRDLAFNMANDLFNSNVNNKAENLRGWFINHFGETMAKEYFIPYNRKIWNRQLTEMSADWIEGKLPVPNKKDVFESLLEEKTDDMPHSKFYYPKANTQNAFINALGNDLNITKNYEVNSLKKVENKWIVNDEKKYDKIINTMPLKELPFVIKDSPKRIREAADKLKYNKVTTALWESDKIDGTWNYIPSSDSLMHRHILIGNFIRPKKPYVITEIIGEHDYNTVSEEGNKFDYLNNIVDHNISNYAYVVYDKNYKKSKQNILDYLNNIGLYTLGRFGEWEYYNMDICIEKAMDLHRREFK